MRDGISNMKYILFLATLNEQVEFISSIYDGFYWNDV